MSQRDRRRACWDLGNGIRNVLGPSPKIGQAYQPERSVSPFNLGNLIFQNRNPGLFKGGANFSAAVIPIVIAKDRVNT